MTKEQIEQIVQQNMQKIYLYCVRRLGSTTEAEDVCSDIILELLRSYARVEHDEAIYGYIWSVANNLCKNHWRKQAKYEHAEISEDYSGIYMVTPEESFLHKQDVTLLRRELSMLSNTYRRIMIEHYIKNKKCDEIAQQMHMSVTNVKQYLFEGRKKVREGMDMQREYGVHSYAPEKFTMNFWGDNAAGYWELFRRKLPGNIMLAVYDKPRSIEELSMEVGVAVPYLEEEVELLEQYELLIKRGNKYHSNIVIYNNNWFEKMNGEIRTVLDNHFDNIKAMVDKGVSLMKDTDYYYCMDDANARRWFILMLIFWEAMQNAEEKMKTQLNYPLLANGGNGYVMGMRGEFPERMAGIYGMYPLDHGYMRILNYKLLSDQVLNPFERGYREVLIASEGRMSEVEQMESLQQCLENSFVRMDDEKITPCYAEISEKDYQNLKEKLADEINLIATLAAEHRDRVGKELEKITPKDITVAKEIGSIVSMWSLLENIVPVVLDHGYMEKGKEGQNLTVFYFKQ